MNRAVLMGRLTRDPEIRQAQGENGAAVAKYTLAVDRRGKSGEADFIPCAAFGKTGEFAGKYLKKGMKIAVQGRIQTGSYTNKDGAKVYTVEVVVDEQEFAEKRSEGPDGGGDKQPASTSDGFMNIPEGIEENLPF